jgi:hypothetical protein
MIAFRIFDQSALNVAVSALHVLWMSGYLCDLQRLLLSCQDIPWNKKKALLRLKQCFLSRWIGSPSAYLTSR